MKVYIGSDSREQNAYKVTLRSLLRHSSIPLEVTPLDSERLAHSGLLRRAVDRRGQMYDIPSNAPMSTDFAISRFLTPILAQTGWALFIDCDMLFMDDVAELFALADQEKAVMVVKHHNGHTAGLKMDGQQQVLYPRKNWSSVCMFNCDHPANQRLSLQDVNERPGRDLHRFYWLNDDEIGELPPEWNVLIGIHELPQNPKLIHYTLGTPDMVDSEHAELWLREYAELS